MFEVGVLVECMNMWYFIIKKAWSRNWSKDYFYINMYQNTNSDSNSVDSSLPNYDLVFTTPSCVVNPTFKSWHKDWTSWQFCLWFFSFSGLTAGSRFHAFTSHAFHFIISSQPTTIWCCIKRKQFLINQEPIIEAGQAVLTVVPPDNYTWTLQRHS